MVRLSAPRRLCPSTSALISSTNQSPDAALREGHLRQDLYFRINTVSIEVAAPARAARTTFRSSFRAFLDRLSHKHAAAWRASIRKRIGASSPGRGRANVRELPARDRAGGARDAGPMIRPGRPARAAPPHGPRRGLGPSAVAPIAGARRLARGDRARVDPSKRSRPRAGTSRPAAALLGLRRPHASTRRCASTHPSATRVAHTSPCA